MGSSGDDSDDGQRVDRVARFIAHHRDTAAYADDPYGVDVTNVSVSEIVARAIVVGNLEIQMRNTGAFHRAIWRRRLDAAETLLVEALAARHVYTWKLIQSEYRPRAAFEVEDFLEEMGQ